MQVVPLALICVGFDLIFIQASAAPGDFDIVDYQYRDGKTLPLFDPKIRQSTDV